MLGMKCLAKTWCSKKRTKSTNAVSLIDSGFQGNSFTLSYSTPLSDYGFYSLSSKTRPNWWKGVRLYSCSPYKEPTNYKYDEHQLKTLEGKAKMSLKTVEDTGKGSCKRPEDQIDISNIDVVTNLKRLNAHNDGIYTKITKRFLADPEFLKLAYFNIKSKDGNLTPWKWRISIKST